MAWSTTVRGEFPGMMVKIRRAASVRSEQVGLLKSGVPVEVFLTLVDGYFRLCGDQASRPLPYPQAS